MEPSAAIRSGSEGMLRQLKPHWNTGLIAASIAISLIGAFTSTQLMCQARTSVHFSSVLIWTILGSLAFGFCSIWSLHFVAMLACDLDLPIGINVPLTVLSSILAVFFTFAALATDLLWEAHSRRRKRPRSKRRRRNSRNPSAGLDREAWYSKSKQQAVLVEEGDIHYRSDSDDTDDSEHRGLLQGRSSEVDGYQPTSNDGEPNSDMHHELHLQGSNTTQDLQSSSTMISPTDTSRPSSDYSDSRRSSFTGSSPSLANIVNLAHRSTAPAKNAFIVTGEALYLGCTLRNILKAFSWSLAVSGMHYVGIAALRIPQGHLTLDPFLVVLSGLISWAVCLVGIILMSSIETHLAQQLLFSAVASTGVAAMHFTGLPPK